MIETWRWFGPNDPISLKQIVQAGATGVVTALHEVPTGETWTAEAIAERKAVIEAAGLEWRVVESVQVHEDIKTRTGDWQRYLANYQQTLLNLGEAGIRAVCYNFMPVLDWTRTTTSHESSDATKVLRFDRIEYIVYDVFILQRPGAENDYEPKLLAQAEARFQQLSAEDQQNLEDNILLGLPGGYGDYDRQAFREALACYRDIDADRLKKHLYEFLQAITPFAERAGIMMCIHPDDPPFPLFGLPRVVSTAQDARDLMAAADSVHNGLTLCAGSFGARGDNDLVAMLREFAPRVHFVHLRNVKRETDGSFYESEHLDGDNDMIGLIGAILDEEDRRQAEGREDLIPMRPDHGGLMENEEEIEGMYPGYSYGGRMKGLAEIRGVTHALESLRAVNRSS